MTFCTSRRITKNEIKFLFFVKKSYQKEEEEEEEQEQEQQQQQQQQQNNKPHGLSNIIFRIHLINITILILSGACEVKVDSDDALATPEGGNTTYSCTPCAWDDFEVHVLKIYRPLGAYTVSGEPGTIKTVRVRISMFHLSLRLLTIL